LKFLRFTAIVLLSPASCVLFWNVAGHDSDEASKFMSGWMNFTHAYYQRGLSIGKRSFDYNFVQTKPFPPLQYQKRLSIPEKNKCLKVA
jgi:hypothetical protein